MKAKLISDGVQTRIIDENGVAIQGVISVRWEHVAVDDFPTVAVTLGLYEVEVEGETVFEMMSPVDGTNRQIAEIMFADGTKWKAP